MKKIVFILLLCLGFSFANAQTDSQQIATSADTSAKKPASRIAKRIKRNKPDSALTNISKADSLLSQNIAPDSLVKPSDTSAAIKDTATRVVKKVILNLPIDSIYLQLLDNPFFRTKARPEYLVINEKVQNSKDKLFYILLGLIFFLGLIKLAFSRYFSDIFRQFLQPSFRQKQTREQLSQNGFPSLLLNFFFILSGGAFIALLMHYYNLSGSDFEINFIYTAVALFALYAGKYILLSFAGWVFNVKEATETYIFIVFLANKIMGIVLIPFCFIIAFAAPEIIQVSVTLSLMSIFILFFYRYIASVAPVRREIDLSFSHFLFYIFAFEITPLLLIYKILGIYLTKSS